MTLSNFPKVIVNPELSKLLESHSLDLERMQPRCRYRDGRPTEEIIGGRARLTNQQVSVSVNVSVADYKKFHEGDKVSVHVTAARPSGWTDNRGYGHVTARLEGKLFKREDNK